MNSKGAGSFDSPSDMRFGAGSAVQQLPLLIVPDKIPSSSYNVRRPLVVGGSALVPEKCFHFISDVTDALMSVPSSLLPPLALCTGD